MRLLGGNCRHTRIVEGKIVEDTEVDLRPDSSPGLTFCMLFVVDLYS